MPFSGSRRGSLSVTDLPGSRRHSEMAIGGFGDLAGSRRQSGMELGSRRGSLGHSRRNSGMELLGRRDSRASSVGVRRESKGLLAVPGMDGSGFIGLKKSSVALDRPLTEAKQPPAEGSAPPDNSGSQSLPNSRPSSQMGSPRHSDNKPVEFLSMEFPQQLGVVMESPRGKGAEGFFQVPSEEVSASAEDSDAPNDEHLDDEAMDAFLAECSAEGGGHAGEPRERSLPMQDDMELEVCHDEPFPTSSHQHAGDPELVNRLAEFIEMQHSKKNDALIETLKDRHKQLSDSVEALGDNVHSHRLMMAHILQEVKQEIITQASKEVGRVMEEQLNNVMRGSSEPSRPDTRCSDCRSEEPQQDLDIKMVI